eukprot:14929967-Heterocapsa_arctica.AAC.1
MLYSPTDGDISTELGEVYPTFALASMPMHGIVRVGSDCRGADSHRLSFRTTSSSTGEAGCGG